MTDRRGRLILLVLAIAFAVTSLVPGGFGGFKASDFPVQVDRWPAQPAGWAFAIWGLIYLALIVTAAWALLRPADFPNWDRITYPLGLSLFIGLFWLAAAQRAPVLATVMIVPMAIGAVTSMHNVGRERREWLALGLYAGWLTAATGVAVSVVLTGYGILGARAAAITVIVLVLVAAIWVAASRRHILSYRAGVIWALVGVIAQNVAAQDWLITGLCALGIAALVCLDAIWPRRTA